MEDPRFLRGTGPQLPWVEERGWSLHASTPRGLLRRIWSLFANRYQRTEYTAGQWATRVASFIVTRGHPMRHGSIVIYDFLSVIHSNHGPISYPLGNKIDENVNFSFPTLILNVTVEDVILVTAFGTQK